MRIFEQLESKVRSYVRSFPAVFDRAQGAFLFDEHDNRYIDFFAGAGTLNYGHNNPVVTEALIDHLRSNKVVHGLDMATTPKRRFLETFHQRILQARNMDYKIQFTGPTGTNAVETALKLARMVKKRSNVVAFTNGFHGLSLGSLAVTGNDFYRDESFGVRGNVDHLPFSHYFGPEIDTLSMISRLIEDNSSGIDRPAAVILETIQAEGGINVASNQWLQGLESICRDNDILLIVDDIQVGNGRTGPFFSFEEAGIRPDIITLSKSIGAGLPMALVLMRPELDQWKPGEHTGTFRGNNLAFTAAAATLETYWKDDSFTREVLEKGEIVREGLERIAADHPVLRGRIRGRGLIWGLEIYPGHLAETISREAFGNGLVVELSGADGQVIKLLPPLTIEPEVLREGLAILARSVESVTASRSAA